MNEKIFFISIIVVLIGINIFTLARFDKLKKSKTVARAISHVRPSEKNDKLNAYKVSFTANLLNCDFHLDSVLIKDSLDNVTLLNEAFNEGQEQILVCRFSQMHCESCVNSSIQILQEWQKSIGKKNVLFLGNHRNNRIFKRTIPLYGIHGMRVYNVASLSIPAEELGYPYYFILNRDLGVSNVFVPDKSVPEITNKYLSSIQRRFYDLNR